MSDVLVDQDFLSFPKTLAKVPIVVRPFAREEFFASPVDVVCRALVEDTNSSRLWITGRLVGAPPSLETVASDFDLISRLVSQNILRLLTQLTLPTESDFVTDLQGVPEPSGQFALRIVGDFSPSKKLTDIWVSCLSALGNEAGRKVHVAEDSEIAQEFSKILSSLLGTIAQQLRYESPSDTLVTRQQRFTAYYQIQLCDAFLIIPDQAAEFLGLLYTELSNFLRADGTLSGDWGELRISSAKELFFKLSPPDFVVDPAFEESEEIE